MRLNQLLEHLGLTIADLPTLPAMAMSETSICDNFILSKCVHTGCLNKHVDAADVTNNFATKIPHPGTPKLSYEQGTTTTTPEALTARGITQSPTSGN